MSSDRQDFRDLLKDVQHFLQAEQRVSYRGLKRQFNLSDDDLEDIKDELIFAQKLAHDEGGKVLAWGASQSRLSASSMGAVSPESVAAPHAGEKKYVTVLFCDIVDSMPLTEKLGLEVWHDAINEFFDILSKAIRAHEGTPCKFTGDGIMALFGAPISAEDHALSACLAALQIREDIEQWNRRIMRLHGAAFQIRIGLNTGEAVVGLIGDPKNQDYTANGNAVGVAARLEGKAETGQIIISESCEHEVRGRCLLSPLGEHPIKGVKRPIALFALNAVHTHSNRFDVSRQRGLSPFVGRDDDIATLEKALERAHSGTGRLVGIEAEAGTGKSRLCFEFLQSCRARGMTVLEGHAVSHGKNIPYLPMLQVFRSYYGITLQDDDQAARDKVLSQLAALDIETQELSPLVFELLGITDPQAPPLRMDPDAKQRQLFGLLKRIVQGSDPNIGNIVTCIEDLHWLDPASALFLEQWAEAIEGSNSLLIVSFRPGYRAEWMSKPYYRQLNLAALPARHVHSLLLDLLGNDPSTAGLADEIFERSGGNPFFCEEIVQSLRESGDLTQIAVTYQLNRSVKDLSIPTSVQSVLSARIDRLHQADKAVLQTAAVIGREFSLVLLTHACQIQEADLLASLARLKEHDFIFEHSQSDDRVFTFKHALTQEVALNSQLVNTRHNIHARVAQGIEELHADKLDEMSALAAYHWEQANQNLGAAAAYCRAALHVSKGNRLQGMDYIRRALELTDNEPASETRHQIRLQALAELIAGGAWRFDMSHDELEAMSAEAQALAEGAGLIDLAVLLRAGHSAALGMMRGDVKRWGSIINDIAANLDGVSAEIEAAILGNQGYCLYVLGELERGLQQARRGLEMANGDASFGLDTGYSVLVTCQNEIVLHATALGQFELAIETNQQGQAHALANGLTEELIWHLSNQSEALLPVGYAADHPLVIEAVSNAAKAHELAEQSASDYTRGVASRALAISRLLQGRFAEAEQAFEDCLNHCRQQRAHLEVEAHCLELLGEAQLGTGKVSEALTSTQQAIKRASEQGTAYFECLAQIQMARCLLQIGVRDEAEKITAALNKAEELVATTGALSQAPQIIELRAALAEGLGEGAAAEQGFKAALEGYRAIGAQGHADRLEGAG